MKARQAKIIASVDGTANFEAWRLLFPGATITVANGTATITVSGGGGGDHATLTHRAWVPSLHTGTPSRFAVFDSGGAAAYLAYPSAGIVAWTGSSWAATTIDAPLTLAAGHMAITQSDSTHDGYLSATDFLTFSLKVSTSRTISTTTPLTGGGDLSANRTIAITQSDATHDGYLSQTDWGTFNAKPPSTRSISTTLPLAGGGDLSADRTLSLSGWSGTTDEQILYRSGSAVATPTVSASAGTGGTGAGGGAAGANGASGTAYLLAA